MGSKIYKTAEIFDKVDHLKSQGVTYWAKKNGQPVAHYFLPNRVNLQLAKS
jgi:hypothetical protein